ncbi:MAG: TldD/PmbA family protein [Candidatus Hodarchaeota archaeon]
MTISESTYHDLASQVVKRLTKNNTEIEVYYQINNKLQISIEQSTIKSEREEVTQGFSFRVAKGKKIGRSYSNTPDLSKMEETCVNAIQIANKSPVDKYWSGLPSSSFLKSVKGIFDTEFAGITPKSAIEMISTSIEPIKIIEKQNGCKISSQGQLIFNTELEGIVNSNGIDRQEKRTKALFYLSGNCKKNDEVSGGIWDAIFTRNLAVWTFDKLKSFGHVLGEKIINNLGSQPIPSLMGQIILHPDVVTQLCEQTLIPALSAEQIHAKRSPLADKIGYKEFESVVDISDDGTIPHGLNSCSFDGEGVGRKGKTQLINHGIIKSYLYDHYHANIFNAENTANSKRQVYSSSPRIYSTNLIITSHGNKMLKDIISDTEKGALIGGFSGNCNFENGEFSGVCKNSFLIKNGEKQFPLKDTTISGNFYDVLSKGEYSKDRKITFRGIEAPALIYNYD